MVRLSPGFAHVALSMSAVQLLHTVRVAVFMLCLPFLAVAGILVATGAAKAAAIGAMVNGPKTPDCPASLLRDHPDIRLFLDNEAAGHIC